MASDGVGKMRRKTKDAGKPYDRPSKSSFIGTFGSKLKNFLTPSWLRDLSWPVTNSDADTGARSDTDEEEEPEEVMAGVEGGQAEDDYTDEPLDGTQNQGTASDSADSSVKATNEGILVECDGFQAVFPHSICGDQSLASSDGSLSSISRPPLSSVAAAVDHPSTVPCSEMQPSTSRGSGGQSAVNYGGSSKRSAPQPSGDDSSSDASEAIGLDKVGAPSKKRCVERDNMRTAVVDPPDEEGGQETSRGKSSSADKSFIWKTKSNPSSASGSGSFLRQTLAASGMKPKFDPAMFSTTMNHSNRDSSLLNTSQRQSPFYSGKTMYGGAASARTRTTNNNPDYQVLPSVRHQVSKIRPVASTSCERPLSSTAKLILEGMDKTEKFNDTTNYSFDSGHVDSLLSFTPSTTYKRNSLQASGSKTQLVHKAGPPVHEQVTPTFAMIQQNIRAYQGAQQDNRSFGRTANVVQDVARSSTNATMSYDLPSAMPNTQAAPGKMRREHTRKHYSNRAAEKEDETPMVVDLPSIALPVTNMRPFTSNILSTSSSGFFAGSRDRTEPMDTTTFTFSKPIMMSTDSTQTEKVEQKSFSFSSPIAVDDHRSNGVTPSSQQPQAPSSAIGTSEPAVKSPLAFSFNVNAAVKKPQANFEPPSGGFAPASELKRGSVMDFLGQPMNSGASKASPSTSAFVTSPATKPVTSPAGVVDNQKPLSELFKAPPTNWSCPGCFVQNDNKLTTCPCCGESMPAAKPSAVPTQASVPISSTPILNPLSDLFKPSSDMWKCPTCDVKNSNHHSTCPCCLTVKPSGPKPASQPVTNSVFGSTDAGAKSKEEPAKNSEALKSSNLPSLSSLFQKPPGDWVCPTCSVPNKEQQLRCCACEEPKPGAKPVSANGASAPTAGPNGGQAATQGFSFNPATFGSSATSPSVFKAPSGTGGTGIAPSGGFRMTVPSGGFSGFGTGFSAPQSSSEKPDSASSPGGFKPTGFSFGQAARNDTNGPSAKPEILSFLPSSSGTAAKSEANAVTSSSGGTPFSSNELKPSGFSCFKPNNGSGTDLKAAAGGFTFGTSSFGPPSSGQAVTSGFQFGEKNDKDTSTLMQRPPLRPSADNRNGNCNVSSELNIVSSSQNNRLTPVSSSLSTVAVFGSETSSVFDSAKSVLPTSTTTTTSFSFVGSTQVVSSSALFGLTKPSTDVSASKFNFSATPASTAAPAFGAPSTSLASGAMQPVFSAPSSITSASVAPPVSAAGGFFAPTTMPVDKPVGQETAKPGLFSFAQKPSEAGPGLFKFGDTQPVKDEAKPPAGNIFQFGQQQSQNAAPTGLFQFGASSSNAAPGAGMFNSTGTSQPAAAPVFGQAPPATVPGMFSFGAGSSAQSNPAGVFTFGAKPSDGSSKPDVMPSFSQVGSKRSMDDDAVGTKRGRSGSEDMPMQDVEPLQTPKQPSVGFAFNAPPTGFGFTAPQTSTPVNNTGFFGGKPANPMPGFGNPSSAAAPATASFTFTGQQPTAPAPSFGTQSVSNLANGTANTGFSFGTGAVAPPSFNFASTPSFNFSGTPSNASGNNPFNAQPSGAVPPGRIVKKAIRRTVRK